MFDKYIIGHLAITQNLSILCFLLHYPSSFQIFKNILSISENLIHIYVSFMFESCGTKSLYCLNKLLKSLIFS